MSKKIAEIVTQKILNELSNNQIPWNKPWAAYNPRNIAGNEYRGINRLITSISGFKSPFWLTFKQCKKLGGTIIKGSTGTQIVFWKWIDKKSADSSIESDNPESESRDKYCLLRYYTVFNLEQTTGINPDKLPKLPDENVNLDLSEMGRVNQFIDAFPDNPQIEYHAIDKAFYNRTSDTIRIPESKYFHNESGYYSTLFHEIGHWTGHKTRLNREYGAFFGDTQYSKEELIAELFAAFCLNHLRIDSDIRQNAAYCQSWLKVLQDNPVMLIHAAANAQKAFDYCTGIESTDLIKESDFQDIDKAA